MPWAPFFVGDVIKFRGMEKLSLKQRVIRGGFWAFAARIVSRAFSFLRLIVLARLLIPEDFGLMGVALLSLSTLETFSETGFNQALIQKQPLSQKDLDTSWTISVIRGLVLFLVLFFAAPFLALFFSSPQAESVVRLIAFGLLFNGLVNSGIIFFQKEIDFKKQFYYQFSGDLVDLLVAIGLALWWGSVWALVFGFLAGSLTRLVFSYLIHSYRPSFRIDKQRAKELFQFGKWIFVANLIVFFLTQGDDAFVGKFLGITALGFYQLAFRLSNLPATEITHVISQVTFPAYSKLQKNINQFRQAYLRTLSLVSLIAFPLAIGLFILAPEIVKLLLGEKWLPIIPVLRVLSLFGIIRAITGVGGSVILAAGKPQLITYVTSIQLAIMAILIYPFARRWDIFGVGLVVFLVSLISLPAQSLVIKQVELSWGKWLKSLSSPVFASMLMALILLIVKFFLGAPSFISLLLLVLLGIITYSGLVFSLDRDQLLTFIRVLKKEL